MRRIRNEENTDITVTAVESIRIVNNILINTIGGERYAAFSSVYVAWFPKLSSLRDVIFSFMNGDTRYNSLKDYVPTYVPGDLVVDKYVKDGTKIYSILESHTSISIADSITNNKMAEYVPDENLLVLTEIIRIL